MSTTLTSLGRIGTSQIGLAARLSTFFLDAANRAVTVQTDAINGAFGETVKQSQELMGRDMLASPGQWPVWYLEWARGLAMNSARLSQEAARKIHEATLQTQTELQHIVSDQVQVLTKVSKEGIERIREQGAAMMSGWEGTLRTADEVAGLPERSGKKAA